MPLAKVFSSYFLGSNKEQVSIVILMLVILRAAGKIIKTNRSSVEITHLNMTLLSLCC